MIAGTPGRDAGFEPRIVAFLCNWCTALLEKALAEKWLLRSVRGKAASRLLISRRVLLRHSCAAFGLRTRTTGGAFLDV